MRRSDEEFKEEVLKRSHEYIKRRKNTQRNIIYAGAGMAVFLIAIISVNGRLFSQNMKSANQELSGEAETNMYVYNETNEETYVVDKVITDIVVDYTTPEAFEDCTVIPETLKENRPDLAEESDNTEDICIRLLDFKAECTRVDGSGDLFTAKTEAQTTGSAVLPIFKMDTLSELNAFVTKANGYIYIWNSFNEVADKYDEAFFEDNTLLLVYVGEGSGSIRHKVLNVTRKGQKLNVEIERIVPEIGTCDMAGWLIAVELNKQDIAGCTEFAASWR